MLGHYGAAFRFGSGRHRGGLSACPDGWGTRRGPVLASLAERTFSTVEFTADDYRRAAELVLTYEDLPLKTTDAHRRRSL